MPSRWIVTSGLKNTRPRNLYGPKAKNSEPTAIRRKLLGWYDRHRRDLPWRKTEDPYRIWVSEVMLQQTRVQAVIPFYETFLTQFPDVRKLAGASERKLLACWSGLGYYSRARNLQKAARIIVREHGGRYPREFAAALKLPGVGVYTAAAVLSIAYGKALPVVDGNVARVLARFFAVDADPRTAAGRAKISRLAASLISSRRPGDFNQAIMELGATICLPRKPECWQCPVQPGCRAHRRKQVTRYPISRLNPIPVMRRYTAAVVQDKLGRVLLVRRPKKDPWLAGFWELPMWEASGGIPLHGLKLGERLGTVRHNITQNRLEVAVFRATFQGRDRSSHCRWVPLGDFKILPVSTIVRKALALRS